MLLDISQPVTTRTAAWPGDEPFSCGWTAQTPDLHLGWAKTSPHVGTHVDAPIHFDAAGGRVGALPLDAFLGPALVVDARGHHALDADLLRGLDLAASPRVLFRTRERADPERFEPRFPVLTPAAIEALRAARVRLVGVDQASFDPFDAKQLVIHRALAAAGMVNVENLRLDDVSAGRYELLAAPIRWDDMDAAPLRALLRK